MQPSLSNTVSRCTAAGATSGGCETRDAGKIDPVHHRQPVHLQRMSYTIGIDVGGTFTDIVVAATDGQTIIAKAATTPADQSDGVLEGIALAADALGLTTADLLHATIAHRAWHDRRHQRPAGGQGRPGRHADDRGPSRRDRDAGGPEARPLQPAHDPPCPIGAAPPAPGRARTHASRWNSEIPLDPASLDRAIDSAAGSRRAGSRDLLPARLAQPHA